MDRDILQALVKAVELKDQSTAAHTWRVALYTLAVTEALGIAHDEVPRYLRAAVLHDVGKIDIPQAILAKPDRLTEDEYETIKSHTVLGYDRLQRMGETDPVILDLVRHHHERIDGTGYPDGLKGDEISIPARHFAVIDSFDAMTSIRAYRARVPDDAAREAIAEIERLKGRWYCPKAVDTFVGLYRAGKLDWILAYFNKPEHFNDWDVLPDFETLASHPDTNEPLPDIVTRATGVPSRERIEGQ